MSGRNAVTASRVNGGAPLQARVGQGEGAGREVERGQPDLAGQLRAGLLPVQPARDYQVDQDEAVALELDHDPLAEPPQPGHRAPGDLGRGGVDRAQHERVGQAQALEPGAPDASVERLEIDADVRQLAHAAPTAATEPPAAPPSPL